MASTEQHVSLLARSFSTAQLAKQLSSHIVEIVARARLKSDTLFLGRNDEVLTGHPKAMRAYAWSSPIKASDKRRLFAVLHMGPIRSPVDAVRAAIVAEHRRHNDKTGINGK
jgi:hypothetical protein